MSLVAIAIAIGVVALVFALAGARRGRGPVAPPVRAERRAVPRGPAASSSSKPSPEAPQLPSAAPPAPEIPAELLAFSRRRPEDLDEVHRNKLLNDLRRIPRPPRDLHKLISPEFLSAASSNELAELIGAEPVIAAKVMATVNSPMYQLRSPVNTIGQAVTFLGLNSVRVICLRYMLADSFPSANAGLKQLFDELWQTSTVAGELCLILAQKLRLPEPGALLTQMVLSSLGRFASVSLLSADEAPRLARMGLLARSVAEQERLGLTATGLTALLLGEWALPSSLSLDACAIDAVLTTPPNLSDSSKLSSIKGTANAAGAESIARQARLGLCYLCNRLAEQLVTSDTLPDISRLLNPSLPDFHHLNAYLQLPPLARLPELIQSQEFVERVLSLHQRLHAAEQAV